MTPRIIIVPAGTPFFAQTQRLGENFETWVSVEDWIDPDGIQQHSLVEQDGVIYTTAAGAAALTRTEMQVAA